MVRMETLGIDYFTTYKGQLQLLSRVSMFHDKLAKCLPDAMANSVFGNLVEVII